MNAEKAGFSRIGVHLFLFAFICVLAFAEEPEAVSLLGKPLYAPPLSAEQRQKLEANYAEAKARFGRDPQSEENIIWLGRRAAYLGRFREAVQVYTGGLKKHPASYRLLRHRGHRYITTRQFDRAIADLERAANLVRGVPAEVEPDGQPNLRGVPHGTTQTSIWYHLGLARYLKGDFQKAEKAYRQCLKLAANDEMRVATTDWLYMTLRRLGRDADARRVLAPIRPDLDIVENVSYYQRLLMYQGLKTPESLLGSGTTDPTQLATQGYGVANWHFYNGEKAKAHELFERILTGTAWPAFGYIAAEAELARGRNKGC